MKQLFLSFLLESLCICNVFKRPDSALRVEEEWGAGRGRGEGEGGVRETLRHGFVGVGTFLTAPIRTPASGS